MLVLSPVGLKITEKRHILPPTVPAYLRQDTIVTVLYAVSVPPRTYFFLKYLQGAFKMALRLSLLQRNLPYPLYRIDPFPQNKNTSPKTKKARPERDAPLFNCFN